MLMQNDDKQFRGLLTDYAAPSPDDGFTETVMRSIDILEQQTLQVRQMKTRLYSLYGAAFLGGIMASLQLPSLITLFERFTFTLPDLSNISTNLNLISIGLILAIALWIIFDNKITDIF